jgi:hypothetical protein
MLITSSSRSVTETLILRLRDGVNLEHIFSNTSSNNYASVDIFGQLMALIQAQPGFVRQFWVTMVDYINT